MVHGVVWNMDLAELHLVSLRNCYTEYFVTKLVIKNAIWHFRTQVKKHCVTVAVNSKGNKLGTMGVYLTRLYAQIEFAIGFDV